MDCIKCGGKTKGFKCDDCGAESSKHDKNHSCGGARCMPKCVGCNEAQAKCSC